jgi:hypothetical protein
MAGGIITNLAASLVAVLSGPGEVHLAQREVRLSDVAEVRGAGAEAARSLVIARLPAGAARQVRRSVLAQLVRRSLPNLQVIGDTRGSVILKSPAAATAEARCFEPVSERAAGESAAPAAVARCGSVAAVYVPEPPLVRRGDKLTLRSTAGPVIITREVVALQDARSIQQHLFVRSADGQVFAAPLHTRESQ